MKNFSFAALALGMIFLAGCARGPQDTDTLTVWHWMTDRHETFLTLAEKYKAQTGITVDFQLFAPSDIYSQKVVAAAQARILPDIFGILDETVVGARFINAGFVADLTDAFEADGAAWKNRFFEKALAVNVFEKDNVFNVKPGIYGVPLDVTTTAMVYNKDILAQAGAGGQLPQTFDDFVALAQDFKKIGVAPLVSGWGEIWLIDCFASNYAFNIMGEDKVMATYRGEVPYTDPDWIKVLSIFQTLRDEGVINNSIVTKDNKIAEQDFALGRAAFAFNGSWCVNVYHGRKGMNPKLNFGVMLPPSISTKYPLKIWGGAGSSFRVNNLSANKDKAIAFLKWLTEKEQQEFLSEQTKNLPANRYALASLPEELVAFGAAMEAATHPTIWPAAEDLVVEEKFLRGIQSIIIGEQTPEQVARDVQEFKERRMQRKR